jgi:hypothetical protein
MAFHPFCKKELCKNFNINCTRCVQLYDVKKCECLSFEPVNSGSEELETFLENKITEINDIILSGIDDRIGDFWFRIDQCIEYYRGLIHAYKTTLSFLKRTQSKERKQ